jgi:hypothetical protein
MCKHGPLTLNNEKLNYIAAFSLYSVTCNAPPSATKTARAIYDEFIKQTNTDEKYLGPAVTSVFRDIKARGEDQWCGDTAPRLHIE